MDAAVSNTKLRVSSDDRSCIRLVFELQLRMPIAQSSSKEVCDQPFDHRYALSDQTASTCETGCSTLVNKHVVVDCSDKRT